MNSALKLMNSALKLMNSSFKNDEFRIQTGRRMRLWLCKGTWGRSSSFRCDFNRRMAPFPILKNLDLVNQGSSFYNITGHALPAAASSGLPAPRAPSIAGSDDLCFQI